MTITIDPKYVFKRLLILIFILMLCNIGVNFIKFNYVVNDGIWSTNKWVKRLIHLFDMNSEMNIPTFYSSLALLASSILLLLTASFNRKNSLLAYPWALLGIIFLILSLDEILELHEHFVRLTQDLFELTGWGTAYWIIPYGTATIILFLILFKFLKQLPRKTSFLFILSGFIFLFGAIGIEIIGGRYVEFYGDQTSFYSFIFTIEEVLEMSGIATFIYSILSYKSFSIEIK